MRSPCPLGHPFTCESVIAGEGTLCGELVRCGSNLLALANLPALELAGEMQFVISYL